MSDEPSGAAPAAGGPRWWRRLLVVLGVLVLLYAGFGVAVLRTTDPLVLTPFVSAPLGFVADVTTVGGAAPMTWRAGATASIAVHVTNHGRLPVRVTAFEPHLDWNVETVRAGLVDPDAREYPHEPLPFRAFTLWPNQYRDLYVTYRMVHCTRAAAGRQVTANGLGLRFRVLGWPRTATVPLEDAQVRVVFDQALDRPATLPAWCERYAARLDEQLPR